jgi:hypothetical protein
MIIWLTYQPAIWKKHNVHWDVNKSFNPRMKERSIMRSALTILRNVKCVMSTFLNKCKVDIIVYLISKRDLRTRTKKSFLILNRILITFLEIVIWLTMILRVNWNLEMIKFQIFNSIIVFNQLNLRDRKFYWINWKRILKFYSKKILDDLLITIEFYLRNSNNFL